MFIKAHLLFVTILVCVHKLSNMVIVASNSDRCIAYDISDHDVHDLSKSYVFV